MPHATVPVTGTCQHKRTYEKDRCKPENEENAPCLQKLANLQMLPQNPACSKADGASNMAEPD
jgi:hypothetical protein